jgi:hypothetical protein
MLLGTRQRLGQVKGMCDSVDAVGVPVKFGSSLKLLGVTFDETLLFNRHVSEVVRTCNFHLRALRRIRPLLSREAANVIGASIVGSRLDYCNSLFYGMTLMNTDRLQRVQNSLARCVCQARWTDNAATLTKALHWLPVRERIKYKIALITHKARQTGSPSYLSDMINDHRPVRSLPRRECNCSIKHVPRLNLAPAPFPARLHLSGTTCPRHTCLSIIDCF